MSLWVFYSCSTWILYGCSFSYLCSMKIYAHLKHLRASEWKDFDPHEHTGLQPSRFLPFLMTLSVRFWLFYVESVSSNLLTHFRMEGMLVHFLVATFAESPFNQTLLNFDRWKSILNHCAMTATLSTACKTIVNHNITTTIEQTSRREWW